MVVHTKPLSPAPPLPLPPLLPLQTPAGLSMKKRKGKAPTPNQIYEIKHRLSDQEAKKIKGPTTTTSLPMTPNANTSGQAGIVIHGIILRKELRKVKQWLEATNKELGKIKGIYWLRKRNVLEENSKKTSSVVIYLEREMDVEKVRLSRQWYKSVRYESEREQK
ncbi:hypothetical protein BDZ91DRAFT_803217 [Kalaharituber pfeilii]|nr:hypothetical protein BDZ91DRAFT_803217 [Kalaharituber pfeilii]